MVAIRCNFSLSVCMCHSIASPLHPVHLFSSSILFSQNLNVPPPSSRLLSLFLVFFEPLEKGCFSAVQAKDKSPHTHTHAHTHLILWVLTTKWHTVWMLYLYVSVLCPWHFCNYLWVKKKYLNAASACEMLHRINKRGCRGPARLSDSHPDWELRGFEDESCSCIFYKPALQTICSPTRSHMHTLTHKNTIRDGRVHQGNVPLFNGTWSYMCKQTRTHTLS